MRYRGSPKHRLMWGALIGVFLSSLHLQALAAKPQPVESVLFPSLGIRSLELPVSPGTRRCCLLGTNLKMFGIIPGKQTWDPSQLGEHRFGGGPGEYNGNIATCRAGFIDTAHVRYAADLVAKLALQIEELGPQGGRLKPHFEATQATLDIGSWPAGGTPEQQEYIIETAGAIALDQVSWHEIVTWYDYSTMPLYTEKGSSFSPEDAYSNQLGINIGKKALRISNEKHQPYEKIVTRLLNRILQTMKALPEEGTTRIMQELEAGPGFDPLLADDPWFDPKYQIPNYRRLLKRQTKLYGEIKPTVPPGGLLLDLCGGSLDPEEDRDLFAMDQKEYRTRYTFALKLKRGSKAHAILHRKRPVIRAEDFPDMIREIEAEIALEWLHALL